MNLFSLLSSDTSVRVMMTFGHSMWQGLLIALAAVLAVRLYGRQRAELRYWTYISALALLVACLPATYLVIEETAAFQPPSSIANEWANPGATGSDAVAFGPQGSKASDVNVRHSNVGPQPGGTPQLTGAAEIPWRNLAGLFTCAYLFGVLLMLARLVVSLFRARSVCQHTLPVESSAIIGQFDELVREMGLRIAPTLALSRRIVAPAVVGFIRPTVLLPISLATALSPNELSSLLAHELAHIRRHDQWVNLFQRFAEAVLFFHPAVWFLSRWASTEREFCCDDIAVTRGLGSIRYAELLIRLAEVRCRLPSNLEDQVALAATGDRPSQLRRRVARLFRLEEEFRMQVTARGCFVVGSSILAAILMTWGLPTNSTAEMSTNNTDAVSSVNESDPAASENTLTDQEESLLGHWQRSSFLVITTLSFTPDRKFRLEHNAPGGDTQSGEWRIDRDSDVSLLRFYESGEDGSPFNERELWQSRLLVVNENELRLMHQSPASNKEVYSWTRVADDASVQEGEESATKPIPLGKVIEITVNDDDPKVGDFFIDFETGRLFSIPKENREGRTSPPPLFAKWIVPNGIDAMGETKTAVKGLLGMDMVAIPIAGPADKLPEISEARLSSVFVDSVPGRPVHISGKGDLPATYLFQTREGTRGVLQIVGFSNEPRGVKLRYKLLAKKTD